MGGSLLLFFLRPNENAKHGADRHPHVFGYGFEAKMFFFAKPKRQKPFSFGHGSTYIRCKTDMQSLFS
jgi:hypothetical protein